MHTDNNNNTCPSPPETRTVGGDGWKATHEDFLGALRRVVWCGRGRPTLFALGLRSLRPNLKTEKACSCQTHTW
jgi:hypothetical protein